MITDELRALYARATNGPEPRSTSKSLVTPNDFYDLADVAARLTPFEEHYNFAARPFNWKYTKQDFDDLLKRLSAHGAGPLASAA